MPEPLKPANPWCWPRPIGSPSDPSAADAWDEGFAAGRAAYDEVVAQRDRAWREEDIIGQRVRELTEAGNAMADRAEGSWADEDAFIGALIAAVVAWRAVAGTEGEA